MRTTFAFHSAGSLRFGRGAVAQLGEVVARLPARRVFVVADPVLASASVLDQARRPLLDVGLTVEVYEGGRPEPTLDLAEDCAATAKRFGPDALVGLGGGSNMDVAKTVAVLLAHGGRAHDFLGDDTVPGPVLPVVCVPTTAGTGSEVSSAAALTDAARQVKVGILSQYLRPRAAVVDPALTDTCPPKVTADSGIDALTHAIEAYTAVDNESFPLPPGERSCYQGKNPIADVFAEKSIELAGRFLRRAVADGSDREARDGMALAATLGGLAFSNAGVALVHALEYPVGGAVPVSHGAGNGLLLPYVMRFNLESRRAAFAKVARLLGAGESAEDAIVAVKRLREEIGIPARLRDLGVRQEQLRDFAEKALAIKRICRVNPRAASVDDLEGIYRAAW